MILALRVVAENNILGGMKIFGFSDYADKDAVGLIKCALRGRPHIKVVSRDDVYSDEKGRLSTTMPELRGLAVVIHNNSDAFGQNIVSVVSTRPFEIRQLILTFSHTRKRKAARVLTVRLDAFRVPLLDFIVVERTCCLVSFDTHIESPILTLWNCLFFEFGGKVKL